MEQTSTQCSDPSGRLESAIRDLQSLQQVLLSGDLDAGILSDFRDALNRIRNIAWAAQQLVASQVSEEGPASVASLIASERIRTAYQLCRAIGDDLKSDDIQFQEVSFPNFIWLWSNWPNDWKKNSKLESAVPANDSLARQHFRKAVLWLSSLPPGLTIKSPFIFPFRATSPEIYSSLACGASVV